MKVALQFPLDVEDDWPPVGSESLPFNRLEEGYECLSTPLFVKDLSVGDVIECDRDPEGFIRKWCHLSKSNRTTVWLLRLKQSEQLKDVLRKLRDLGCNTTGVDEFGCYAVDVPEFLSISAVDAVLEDLDEEYTAVAFPSMRHPE